MIYAGGLKLLLQCSILCAPGTLLFLLAKRERKETTFRPFEALMSGDHDRRMRRVNALAFGANSI